MFTSTLNRVCRSVLSPLPSLNSPLSTLGFFAAAALLAAPAFAQTVAAPDQLPKLIATLKSPDATQKDKADACRQLAVIGAAEAVAPLAALLGDEKLSHMARYGLEPIPSPAVDEALRAALGTLQGRLLAGVMGSLGVRRDPKAVAPLAKFLQDADPEVAQAAARALGSIATPDAAKALLEALPGASPANQVAVCEGALRCAEKLALDRKLALSIYQKLRESKLPHQVRTAAVRGAILLGRDEPLLAASLHSQDYVQFAGAIRAAQELRGASVAKVLLEGLDAQSADRQVVIVQTLGKRGDVSAVPALSQRTKAGDKPVRLAAIHALAEIGHRSALATFRDLLGDGDREIVRAAQESFASLQGREVDAAVLAMVNATDKNQQLAGIELIGRRRMTSSLPALLKAARDPDVAAAVRSAALKQVGELGTTEQAPTVIEVLQTAKGEPELEAAEQALATLCAKAPNPEVCVEQLQQAMAQAQPAQKGALLRVLGTIGGAQALKAVRAAVSDSTPAVRDAAIRALGAWKTAEAGPDLLALAKETGNPAEKMLCLRGFLALMANSELPANQRLTLCREAAGMLGGADEKKMLLAALGGITAPDALEVITPYLSDPATREEAGAAVLGIAERLLRPRNAKVSPKLIQALEKVGAADLNPAALQRAKTLLDQAKKRTGGA